jgi:hypothetical protein
MELQRGQEEKTGVLEDRLKYLDDHSKIKDIGIGPCVAGWRPGVGLTCSRPSLCYTPATGPQALLPWMLSGGLRPLPCGEVEDIECSSECTALEP